MFRKSVKGAETPRFRRGTEAPRPICFPRLCLADGKPATFLRWVDEDKGILQIQSLLSRPDAETVIREYKEQGVVPSSCTFEKLRTCFALVEYPDGSVGKVKPELITFLDRREG